MITRRTIAAVALCLLAVSCQCSKDDSVSQDDPKDLAIEKVFEDYKKVICEKDMEALRRIAPPDPNLSSRQYEIFLKAWLMPELTARHEKDYAEWLKDAYIVRKEYFGDGKYVHLLLGPETRKKEVEFVETPYKQFHHEPLALQRYEEGWRLYLK